jgi:hypothetical protein
VLIATHAAVLIAAAQWGEQHGVRRPNDWSDLVHALGLASAFALALFGVAWALSVYLRSPAIAASIAIGIGFGLLFGGIAWLERLIEAMDAVRGTRTSQETLHIVVAAAAAGTGLLAILATSLHYSRRVEP